MHNDIKAIFVANGIKIVEIKRQNERLMCVTTVPHEPAETLGKLVIAGYTVSTEGFGCYLISK